MQKLTASQPEPSPWSGPVPRILLGWFAGAVLVGVTELIHRDRPFIVPIFIVGGTAFAITAYLRNASIRQWWDSRSIRALIAFHTIRAPIGIAFLWLVADGRLPHLFADTAGWGDIAVGTTGLVLLPFAGEPRSRGIVRLWNALGLLDILVVVAVAQYSILVLEDARMFTMARLPWTLIPTFIVPLVIATHLLLERRLRRPFVQTPAPTG